MFTKQNNVPRVASQCHNTTILVMGLPHKRYSALSYGIVCFVKQVCKPVRLLLFVYQRTIRYSIYTLVYAVEGTHFHGMTSQSRQGSEFLWRAWKTPYQGGEFSPSGANTLAYNIIIFFLLLYFGYFFILLLIITYPFGVSPFFLWC